MTEYWVSQAKYYCKYCNMWMADNKMSRQNHDSGPKHKASVEIFNRKKREEKLHGAKNEKDLQQQLAAIERAATLAMVQDISAPSGQTSSIGPAPHPSMMRQQQQSYPQHPPPGANAAPQMTSGAPTWNMPPRAAPRQQYNIPFQVAKPLSEAAMAAVSENLRKDKSGSYTIRGVTYLEGPFYEHRLKAGVTCEVFIDELDDWLPGKVVRRHNSDLATKSPLRFDISYCVKNENDEGEEKEQIALSVSSDQIRLIDVPPVSGSFSGVPAVPIDANTGVGKWTTVSVTVINEEEEEKKRIAAALAEEEERKQAEAEKKKKEKWADIEGIGRDDALGSFDPYNTGVYKGVTVGGEITETELKPISDGKEVEFKRRKISHNRKGARVTSLDD